jgi:hypothetical protein
MAKVLLPWHWRYAPALGPTYLTVSQEEEEEETFWKNGIFSHYCYKRDDLCQILEFLPQNPCEMLAVEVPSIALLWYSRKTPKRHQADLSSNK